MSEYAFVPIVGKELYHWKYLKKYRKNGKWRYVYADKKTHDKIDSYNFASKTFKSLLFIVAPQKIRLW